MSHHGPFDFNLVAALARGSVSGEGESREGGSIRSSWKAP
jgi:hypothetical protein